jgi:hypothetical protein
MTQKTEEFSSTAAEVYDLVAVSGVYPGRNDAF